MAEKVSTSIHIQKIEDHLACLVCLDQFTDPRTLPCLHSFCVQCLEGLPLDPRDDEICCISCPTCHTEAEVPGQRVAAFPKEVHDLHEEVHDLMNKVHTFLYIWK